MKRLWIFAAVFLGLAELAQTGSQFAGRYWRILSNQEYRFTWHYIPGKPMGFYKGAEPHGAALRTFVNNIAYDAILAKNGKYPVGAMVVKDNHMPNGTLAAITLMVKMMPGYDSANGDWFYAKYNPNGTFSNAEVGKVTMCVGCHAKAKDQDYVFSTAIQ